MTQSLVDEWSSLLGIGKEKDLGSSNILRDESLVVLAIDLNRFVSVETTTHLLQIHKLESVSQIHVLSWDGESGINSDGGELGHTLRFANGRLINAINRSDSENSQILCSKLLKARFEISRCLSIIIVMDDRNTFISAL